MSAKARRRLPSRERSELMEEMCRRLEGEMESYRRRVRKEEIVFHQDIGARLVVDRLLHAGVLKEEFASLVKSWKTARGNTTLVSDGVQIFPPPLG